MEITGVNDYLQECLSYKNRINTRYPDRFLFFRGEAREHERLIPSIYQPKYNIAEEHRIFNETIAAFPKEMLSMKTTIEKLIFMRHYELPTRLLDISKNPLVGLFNACYEEYPKERETEGFVHVFSVPKEDVKFCDSDSVCLIANICKRPESFSIKGITHLKREPFNEEEVIQYLIYEAQNDKPYLKNLALPETLMSVICLHPMMNNPRIINQTGYFFLFGVKGDKKDCAEINKKWIAGKIPIPGDAKKRIREELDFLNINEAFLFPDYKHLANTLQLRYKKKQA